MNLKRKQLKLKHAIADFAASKSKTHLCLIVATLVVFTSFTAFSPSRPYTYNITDGAKAATIETNAPSINEIVKESGIELNPNDIAKQVDNEIRIIRRCTVTVAYHGETTQLVTASETVGDLLDTLGIKLEKNDVMSHDASEALTDGEVITVDEVYTKNSTSCEQIDYDKYLTLAKSSNVSKLIEKTSNKIKVTSNYKLTYKNGEQSESKLLSQKFEEIIPPKKTEKTTTAKTTTAASAKKTTSTTAKNTAAKSVAAGIYNPANAISPIQPKIEIKVDSKGIPVNYSKVIKGKGTAYTGGGITASGRPAAVGYVAVNPNQIPYGTRLFIRSADGRYNYGYAIAADTGGFVNMGRTVDLYFATESQCRAFGVRDVEIYVLK